MKVSLNWLKDYVDLSGITVDEISANLTMSGLEVEDVINEQEMFKGFVIAKVLEKRKHPNADKLSLCIVSTGSAEYQVVCGAPNVDAGQKIVFATIGTIVPNGGYEIKKAKLRGVESYGMICSESELLLSNDHSGIMVLDDSYVEGTPVTEALGLNDVIMEIGITPNRPDALCHLGVARDLAAIFNRKLYHPEIFINEDNRKIEDFAKIEIIDAKNCPRYTGKVVFDIEVKESPDWLKNRLKKIGLRPINNIVDITNYIMFETGQPLHAFDLDKLADNKIIVRSTTGNEKFTTLDSKERELPVGALMICDGDKAVAVAGVMGGENSEITDTTKNVLIESAYFHPSSVRKTAKALGLSTDASYRFERGTDPENTLYAAERTAQLIAELAGGKVLKGTLDVYPEKISPKEVEVRLSRITKVLGFEVPKEKVIQILENLGFKPVVIDENRIKTTVPGFRPDVEREIDLIEEIARINGYDNIPAVSKVSISISEKTDETSFVDKVKDCGVALGFFEMINNPLQSAKFADLTGNKVGVMNPQSMDMAFLRTSLLPGALNVVSTNIKVAEKNLRLFEVGNVINKVNEKEIESFDDFTETTNAIFVITGKENEKTWQNEPKEYDFFSLKGFVDGFLAKISLDNVLNDNYYNREVNNIFEYSFAKSFNDIEIGKGGKVKKDILKIFDIDQDVFCFEFNLNLLKEIKLKPKKYVEPVKYPKVYRDIAFIFDKEITYEEVKTFIKKSSTSLLRGIDLFDIFEKDSLGAGKKSMAFALEFYADDRTLKEEEIEKEFNNIITQITKKFNAQLRGA